MNKYSINFLRKDANIAGSKAESDISFFIKSEGFNNIYYDIDMPRIVDKIFRKYIIKKKLKNICNKDNLFLLQYSLYSRGIFESFVKCLGSNVKKIAFVHDLVSLREENSLEYKVEKEIKLLNKIDILIVHNNKMLEWLVENGCTSKLITLDIFDYLTEDIDVLKKSKEINVVFAGNLDKSLFLNKVDIKSSLNLYGNLSNDNFQNNIKYRGIKSSFEIPKEISKYHFGLVWDGNSVNTCSGAFGEYLRFNNPHKVSLYISSGLPIFIWKESAMAKFVIDNKIGFLIEKISDIDTIIENLDENQYNCMLNNVNSLRKKIISGYYTISAVQRALNEI